MSWISREQRDDFQEETFRTISRLIEDALIAHVSNDRIALFKSVDVIYTLLAKRINNPEFDAALEELRLELYTSDPDDYTKSRQFDKARLLWKELAGTLDELGLLLRHHLDKSELVTRS